MPVHNADKAIDSPTTPTVVKAIQPSSPSSSPLMSLSSLSPSSVLPPTVKRKEAIIIFDWDDTLLASSFLSSIHCRLDTDIASHPLHGLLAAQLAELDQCTAALLTAALHFSPHHVHVVTNAETGWVQLSAAKFLPLTFALLTRCKIVSARSNYESLFPDSPLKWKYTSTTHTSNLYCTYPPSTRLVGTELNPDPGSKRRSTQNLTLISTLAVMSLAPLRYCAFQQQISAAGGGGSHGLARSVISLGDSHVEREAVRAATRGMSHTHCKSVKFSERTDCVQLRRQVELVTRCFSYIASHDADLDLQLTVSLNEKAQAEADKHRELQRLAAERAAEKEKERLRYVSGNECASEYDVCGDSEMGSERESEHQMAIRA